MNLIYLDYNATTPLATEVIEAMKPFMEVYFGNPSSAYVLGQKTRLAVEEARRQVSTLLGCQPVIVTWRNRIEQQLSKVQP